MYRTKIYFLLIAGLMLVTLNNASAQKNYTLKANVSVDGTSSTHDWIVKSDNVPGTFSVTGDNKVETLTVKISVSSLKSILDSKFERNQMESLVAKSFKADKYPIITFQLTDPFTPVISGSSATATLTGNLTMAGVTKKVSFKATGKQVAGGGYEFSSVVPLTFSNFSMKPPVILMVMKVKDPVTVKLNVTIPAIN